MIVEGDKVIYIVKSDGWGARSKSPTPRQYSYYGTVVKIKGSQAVLDLVHPRTNKVVRQSGCPIRNINKVIEGSEV